MANKNQLIVAVAELDENNRIDMKTAKYRTYWLGTKVVNITGDLNWISIIGENKTNDGNVRNIKKAYERSQRSQSLIQPKGERPRSQSLIPKGGRRRTYKKIKTAHNKTRTKK